MSVCDSTAAGCIFTAERDEECTADLSITRKTLIMFTENKFHSSFCDIIIYDFSLLKSRKKMFEIVCFMQ
jgi:hypothetical protein